MNASDADILSKIEDFFYDDNMTEPITEWGKKNCETFVHKDPRNSEQPLEHTALYEDYCSLFENLIANFLDQNSISMSDFHRMCKRQQYMSDSKRSLLPSSATFASVLISFSDFFEFCEMMHEVMDYMFYLIVFM